ncbi:hypothetical protein HN51_040824, partial [Arachis hypogaea]
MELEMQWEGNPSIILDIKTLLGIALPVQKNLDFTLKVVGGDISAIPGLYDAIEVGQQVDPKSRMQALTIGE